VTPVHEVVTPIAGFEEVVASTPRILVEHRPDPTKNRAQYLPLLELAVREDAGDARSRFYLGREYTYVARWRDAIATLIEYLNRHPEAWSFERCSACLMIASCHDRLRQDAERDGARESARQHDADAFRWLLRACHEEPNQREPWVELADACRIKDDHAGTYWAAKKALALTRSSKTHLNEPEDWSWKPHDLLSVAAWYLGLRDESLEHALLGVEHNPHDQRLIDNCLLVQARSATAPAAGPPLVDVVILAYSKTQREYDMTRRCIASLRASSPDVPVRIVVVETNATLRSAEFTRYDPQLFAADVEVVFPRTRFGYNEFVQAGYRVCSGSHARYFMVLNNDVVLFGTGFLRQMLSGLKRIPSVSPLGLREAQWGLVDRSVPLDINYDIDRAVCGWCLMFDKSILATVPFDALFPSEWTWYGQDQAYAAALQAHGLAHGLVTAARALHLQASSHHLLAESSGNSGIGVRAA
jgi:tetratricopeptide (TPR) repeat protein